MQTAATVQAGPRPRLIDQAVPVVEIPTWANILLYGFTGVGKTTLAARAIEHPAIDKVLYLDLEGGKNTLRKFRNDNIRVFAPATESELFQIAEDVWTMAEDPERWAATGRPVYQAVIGDSLTETEAKARGDALADAARRNPKQDPKIASKREWGIGQESVRQFVRGMRDTKVHFIAIAGEGQGEVEGVMQKRPDFSNKLASQAGGFFDVVLWMYVATYKQEVQGQVREFNERRVQTNTTQRAYAKDRWEVLPFTIRNPEMPRILDSILSQTPYEGRTQS